MAIYYFHAERRYYLTTNYKVWYSTLEQMPGLKQVDIAEVIENARKGVAGGGLPNYLLARNPYARLESFFRDKFRQQPEDVSAESYGAWQICQQLFFPVLGVSLDSPFELVQQRLLAFSFSDFMTALPGVFDQDGHLTPQAAAGRLNLDEESFKILFDRVIHTESEFIADREFLSVTLGIDTSIVRNSTEAVKELIEWDATLRAIANEIYAEDFELLGYPVLTE